MNLALNESGLPVRLRFDRPMTDEELMRFCAENETARVERDAKGELIVMSPPGSEGSGWNSEIITEPEPVGATGWAGQGLRLQWRIYVA